MEDIIIIGGGLAGTSLLHALAFANRNAVLLESYTIGGGGATAHSRGMLRVYDPSPTLCHYSEKGLRFWQSFSERHPGLLDSCGLAYFATPASQEKVRAFSESASAAKAGISLVTAESILEMCPTLNHQFVREQRMALWEPHAGTVDPRMAARALVNESIATGHASVVEGIFISRISADAQGFVVASDFGSIRGRRVIVANGAQAGLFHHSLELETRSIILSSFTEEQGSESPNMCIIDEVSGSYLRPAKRHFYIGGGAYPANMECPEQLKADVEAAMNKNVSNLGVLLAEGHYRPLSSHSGYDGYHADYLPAMKPAQDYSVGLFAGFSGRGAKYIPALAKEYVEAGIHGGWL